MEAIYEGIKALRRSDMVIGMLIGFTGSVAFDAILIWAKRKAAKKRTVVEVPEPEPISLPALSVRCESWKSIMRAGDFTGGVAS